MKRTIKVLTSVIAIFIVTLFAIFALNSTDEQQTELTQQMLQKFPAQEGFPLKEFKLSKEDRIPNTYFEKYSDYLQDSAKYDTLIQQNKKALLIAEKAFSIGHVTVNPTETFYDGIYVYPSADHRLFLAFLSQKIKHGKTSEALTLLEHSNRFLASVAETPQTVINKLVSITMLKRNAEYTKSLLDNGAIKKIPPSLKQSFHLSKTPEQMWDESNRKEFQLISTIVSGQTSSAFMDFFSNEETSLPGNLARLAINWIFPKLFRPNQTLNMLSSGYEALSSPECLTADSEKCTYYEDTTKLTFNNFFINPAGRSLVKTLLPRFHGLQNKMHMSTAALNDFVATL